MFISELISLKSPGKHILLQNYLHIQICKRQYVKD